MRPCVVITIDRFRHTATPLIKDLSVYRYGALSMTTSIDVSPCRYIAGDLKVPGDKSISHRTLLVATLAEGELTIPALSRAQDVASTLAAVEPLGLRTLKSQVMVDVNKPSTLLRDWEIHTDGLAGRLSESTEVLDVGNSGSTVRM